MSDVCLPHEEVWAESFTVPVGPVLQGLRRSPGAAGDYPCPPATPPLAGGGCRAPPARGGTPTQTPPTLFSTPVQPHLMLDTSATWSPGECSSSRTGARPACPDAAVHTSTAQLRGGVAAEPAPAAQRPPFRLRGREGPAFAQAPSQQFLAPAGAAAPAPQVAFLAPSPSLFNRPLGAAASSAGRGAPGTRHAAGRALPLHAGRCLGRLGAAQP
eukprot:gene23064-46357_t